MANNAKPINPRVRLSPTVQFQSVSTTQTTFSTKNASQALPAPLPSGSSCAPS